MMWLLLLTVLLVSAVCFPIIYLHNENKKETSNKEFFFGVSFGGNTTSQARLLIDKVKGYTNFVLINNWDISIILAYPLLSLHFSVTKPISKSLLETTPKNNVIRGDFFAETNFFTFFLFFHDPFGCLITMRGK